MARIRGPKKKVRKQPPQIENEAPSVWGKGPAADLRAGRFSPGGFCPEPNQTMALEPEPGKDGKESLLTDSYILRRNGPAWRLKPGRFKADGVVIGRQEGKSMYLTEYDVYTNYWLLTASVRVRKQEGTKEETLL